MDHGNIKTTQHALEVSVFRVLELRHYGRQRRHTHTHTHATHTPTLHTHTPYTHTHTPLHAHTHTHTQHTHTNTYTLHTHYITPYLALLPQFRQRIRHGLDISNAFHDSVSLLAVGTPVSNLASIIQYLPQWFVTCTVNKSRIMFFVCFYWFHQLGGLPGKF